MSDSDNNDDEALSDIEDGNDGFSGSDKESGSGGEPSEDDKAIDLENQFYTATDEAEVRTQGSRCATALTLVGLAGGARQGGAGGLSQDREDGEGVLGEQGERAGVALRFGC